MKNREPDLDLLGHLFGDSDAENVFSLAIYPVYELLLTEEEKLKRYLSKKEKIYSTGKWVPTGTGNWHTVEYDFSSEEIAETIMGILGAEHTIQGLAGSILINSSNILRGLMDDFNLTTGKMVSNPKIENASWVAAVNAASNYVRHGYEWWRHYQSYNLIKVSDENLILEMETIIQEHGSKNGELKSDTVKNIKSLMEFGVKPRDLMSKTIPYRELLEKLGLVDWETTYLRFSEWFESLVSRQKESST